MHLHLDKKMKIARFKDLPFIPASHENPLHPGVLKKVLFRKGDIIPGQIQMVNWAKLLPKKSFQAHYHEDMDEVFILLNGRAKMNIGTEELFLEQGDAVIVPMKQIHTMKNLGRRPLEYIIFGVGRNKQGKTIVTEKGILH